MNRQIKFRGKRKDTGEWVFGDLHLITRAPHIHIDYRYRVIIDVSTIGQFTGLLDANGKEIWEGDILSDEEVKYEVWYSEDKAGFIAEMIDPQNHLVDYLGCYDTERMMTVVGNIYDNPDFAKCKVQPAY